MMEWINKATEEQIQDMYSGNIGTYALVTLSFNHLLEFSGVFQPSLWNNICEKATF